MCAHRSDNFEVDAFTKHRLDILTDDDLKRKDYTSNSTKTTEPRKTVEKRRIYEWAVLMFQQERERSVTEKDGFSYVKSLTTSLKNPDSIAGIIGNNDALELCIDSIFDNTDLINTTDGMDTTNTIDDEAIKEHDDNNNDVSRGKIHALSVIDIFEHANNELLKVNVNQLRINKKKRLQRSDDFYRDIYHTILNDDDQFDGECNDIDNCHLHTKPWLRITYNILL